MIRELSWLVIVALLLMVFSFAATADAAADKVEFMSLDEVRPGMKGLGKTCYEGMQPEEFQAEILGVLHGVTPGTSVVLARFSGDLIDKVGIFEGMSGSPVYIDGKLLGAVAYSFAFAKEPIGGITPISQMVEAFEETAVPSSDILLKKGRLWNVRLPLPAGTNASSQLSAIPNPANQPSLSATFGNHSLVPIATPLSMGGFSPKVLEVFEPHFRAMGMSVLQGVGGMNPAAASMGVTQLAEPPIEPGSNIVIPLVRGDLEVSAGGTVTHLDGNRLYAFGHSMFNLGFTQLPLHKARAIVVIPSLESSFKILEMGEMAGAIRQDRGNGIFGIVGDGPRMVPLKVQLTTSRGSKRDLNFEVARDALLTPLMVNLVVYNAIASSERAQGMVTIRIKGKINVKNQNPVEVSGRFSSDVDAPSAAALSVAVPVNYLMAPGYKNLDLQDVKLEISAEEDDQLAVLNSIRADRTEARAGELLEVEVSYRKVNGELMRDTYPVRVPTNASPGDLMLLVADGSSLMSLDEREEMDNLIPRDLTHLIRLINNLRKNDHLYIRFLRQEPGAVVKGEGLPGLPPSILSILRSDREVGAINSIQTSTLMEYELPESEQMVMGARVLKLTIKP